MLILCLWWYLGCSPAHLHLPEEYEEVLQKNAHNKILLILKLMSTILAAGSSMLFTA